MEEKRPGAESGFTDIYFSKWWNIFICVIYKNRIAKAIPYYP